MPIDRKAKSYEVTCPDCKEVRCVVYSQHWNIINGHCSGRCPKCKQGVNVDGLKLGPGWNRGTNLSGMKGKKQSEKFIAYLKSRTGEKMSDEAKKKMSLAKLGKCGESSNRWDGGKTLRQRKRNLKPFQDWRQSVLKRDSHKCAKCGSSDELHVHHLIPFAKYIGTENENLLLDVSIGVTLCKTHHREEHKKCHSC